MVLLGNAECQYSSQIKPMGTVDQKSIDYRASSGIRRSKISTFPHEGTSVFFTGHWSISHLLGKIPMKLPRSIHSLVLMSFLVVTALLLVNISPSPASEENVPNNSPNISTVSSNISIATAWKNISNDENACINRSKVALQNAGFQNINVSSQSISGDFGQYKGTVRCAASEKMAFFVVAGFNTDTAFRRVSEIYDSF
jgi:hypothetical protein